MLGRVPGAAGTGHAPWLRKRAVRPARGFAAHAASAAATPSVAPRYSTGSGSSTTSSPTAATRYACAAGREATTRMSESPSKCSARAVVDRISGRHPAADRQVVRRPAVSLLVVVHRVRARDQAHALDRPRRAVVAGHRLLEPAQRAGAQAAQHDAGLPRLPQRDVEPMRPQHAHQADHAAAADVDEVLVEHVRAHVVGAAVAPEQRHVRRLAAARGEVAVEADDVVVGVARRGRQEADLRPPAARPVGGEPEHVVVEQRVPGLHREPAAAEGDYLPLAPHGRDRRDGSRPAREFHARGRVALDRVPSAAVTSTLPSSLQAAAASARIFILRASST